MNERRFSKSALRSGSFLIFFLVAFSQNASALKLEPFVIQESEGVVVPLTITISVSDWVAPNSNFANKCAAIGINAAWVARYILKGVSGTAEFSASSSSSDLHISSSGKSSKELSVLFCSPAPFAATEVDRLKTINLLEDDIKEPTETAALELWKVDLNNNKTLISSTLISIDDSKTNQNGNACSSMSLGGNAPLAAGSITAADCDDSPRGSGFLADMFTFSGTQGESVSIHADWENMDGYLYLVAPNGNIEGQNDDFSSKSDSRIDHVLNQTGTYKIWVTTSDPADTGNYEISLTHVPEVLDDWVLTSVAVTPTVLKPMDPLSISVTGQSNGTPTLVSADRVDVVYLLSTDPVISAGDSALGTENLCCASGFADVWQGNIDVAPGTYWAGACITNVDDDPANNCTAGTAVTVEAIPSLSCNSRTLDCGGSVAGNLTETSCTEGPQGTDHYAEKFTFTGTAGATFWLDASWDFDGYLFLKNPLGKIIAENDNHSSSADSHIEQTLLENGTYSLWATSYQAGTTGAYQVALDCDPPAGPDLTVDTLPLQAELLVPGQNLDLQAMLHNSGDQPADSTTLHYVLSSDAHITQSDPEIGSDGAPGLAAGASSTSNKVLVAPITAGEYWLGVCADLVVDESSVSNNCSTGRFIEVKPSPECARSTLSCGQLHAGTLNSQDCTRSPRGVGFLAEVLEVEVEAGSSLVANTLWTGVDGYLLMQGPSGSIVASNDDSGDLLHSRIEYAAQTSGIHRIWTTSFQRDASGSYELELICGPATAPDLVASEVSVSESEVTVEQTINLSAVVYNDGNGASDPGNVHFMLSSDDDISADDTILTSQGLAAIAAGSSLSADASVNVPVEAGHYWLGICVDAVNNEILTGNNCSTIDQSESQSSVQSSTATGKSRLQTSGTIGTLIKASTGASCSNSTLSCGQNNSGTLGPDDCDKGPRGTGYFSDTYTFSGNAGDSVSLNVDWTGLDGYLYLQDPTGALAAENDDFQGLGHSRVEHVLEHSGTYRVWPSAHAQGQGGSYQLNLICNAPAVPDLAVATPQLSATTVRPGQNLSLATQVLNQGNEPSTDTSIQFFLANSATVSATDRVLGKSDVSALAPGGSSDESLSIALDVVPGAYWIAACVNAAVLELNSVNNCALTGPLTVEQNNRPIDINPGLNDAWYDPATSGQGFFINVFPDGDEMFVSWFTYDLERPDSGVPFALGEPGHRWFTALGTYERGVAKLDIFLNEGGVFDQALPAPTESLYGSMTVSFSDCNHGQIEFDLPSAGEQGTIPITRVTTDNLSACEDIVGVVNTQADATAVPAIAAESSATSALTVNPGLNDAWYNPATGGQGFTFNVFPHLGSVYMSWFTYDTELPPADVPAQIGAPGHRWLTALGKFQGDGAEMTLYRVGGGVFNSATPAPQETEYGTVTVRFDDCNSGELRYDIPSLSRQGVVPIQRIAADLVPACEQAQISQEEYLAEISPGNKDVLENFCGGTASWLFNWPDTPEASGYIVELWRNDALTPMTFTVSQSEFRYEKATAIPAGHLTNWQWRYKPQYSAFGKTADFTHAFTFDVGTCEQ